jgi:F-type H+-transporting ATPase subunit b
MVLNLGLLIGLYYYFGKKPIAQGLENRRQGVVREIEEAQRLKHEAEQRAKSYQAKLSHLQEELVVTRHALIETGKGEKERIVREAEEKAARMQREVEFLVEQELKQIRQDLWREAVELAVASAEGVLTKGITQADHERLADEYLKDLAKQPSPASPSAGGVS